MPVNAPKSAFSIVIEPSDLVIRIRRPFRRTATNEARGHRPTRRDAFHPESYPWPAITVPSHLR